jgi:hypothetical protein
MAGARNQQDENPAETSKRAAHAAAQPVELTGLRAALQKVSRVAQGSMIPLDMLAWAPHKV